MSDENVEVLRAYCADWGARPEVRLDLLDPEIVYEGDVLPDHAGETYRGHDGLVRAVQTWLQPYERFTIELERIVGSGDRLVSIHRFRSTARHTGIETELLYAYVWTFRDGKIVHIKSYREPSEALEEAGLSE